LEGVNYAAQKLLDYQRKGDPPSHVTSSLMTLKVTRQSPSDIEDAALDGGEVTFQLPPRVKKDKLNHLDAVNTKVSVNPSLFAFAHIPPINNEETERVKNHLLQFSADYK